MTSFSSSFHLPRHTFLWRNRYRSNLLWTQFCPFLLNRCCRSDFVQKVTRASWRHQHTVNDKLALRFPLDFSCVRSYYLARTLLSISDEDRPAKRLRKSLNHRQWCQKKPSSNTNSPSRKTSQSPLSEVERQWEDFSHISGRCQSLKGRFFDFSVMSYNILSQKLLQDNAHLYKHCSLPILDWNYRYTNIIKEIQRHNSDIVCLQEVQEDHYETQIKPSLESLGYHCEYKKRTGKKPDGCAVVFKQDSFSLVSCHPVEYFKPGIPLLDRDNVGLVLLLQPKVEKGITNHLCVANTHLLYNPRRGDIKLAQLGLLLAEISHVAKQSDGTTCPVILCGDFNSAPWSPLYHFIRESKLEYHGIPMGKVSGQDDIPKGQRILSAPLWPQHLGISQQCQYEDPTSNGDIRNCEGSRINGPCIEHCLNLTSAYSHHSSKRGQPEITTCHSKRAMTVDYIFYSAASRDTSLKSGTQPQESNVLSGEGLHLLTRLALFDETDLHAVNGLPNANNSSDHLPLLACFRLHNLQTAAT
ncbi:protein angel homolog 2 isoform X2 [Clupea harengus]|uniref:Protein angel homolog 2 isoform X2 n=1 Tax=Clupea harengus TaxID=7950 RepID=A0A6P8GE90_CLUHA|nr:protein angel homolog 2 isoform X2 [Clupea harengus]